MISERQIMIKNWSEAMVRLEAFHPNHRYFRELWNTYFNIKDAPLVENDKEKLLDKMRVMISKWEAMTDEEYQDAKGCCGCASLGFHNFPDELPKEVVMKDLSHIQIRMRLVSESEDGSSAEVEYIVYYFENGKWVEKEPYREIEQYNQP
jgi:hypothetical protein